MKKTGVILSLCLLIQPFFVGLQADWKDSIDQTLNETLDKTKEYSDSAVKGTKDLYGSLTGEVKLITSKGITQAIVIEENNQHIKKIWPDVLENLDDALSLNTQIDDAPDSRWFGADKKSLSKKQINVFSEIEALLNNPAISENRHNIDRIKKRINKEQQRIATLKEKRIIATTEEKEALNSSIQESVNNIEIFRKNIAHEKTDLKARLQEMGLMLSHDQIDVLLSRVDSDDIIKMSIMYDVLADITKQLMELTQEFNEDINQARKYYGMHVVLLKMVINMQQSYITKLNNEYLPKIDNIKNETIKVNQESKNLLATEKNSSQNKVLRHNIQAQQLTLKVTKLYTQQLKNQRNKVQEALTLAKMDYRVAKNTFDTVKLSAELIRLMKTNQASFNALMNIQIPEIVPFKNIAMQKKFEELSLLLRNQN